MTTKHALWVLLAMFAVHVVFVALVLIKTWGY